MLCALCTETETLVFSVAITCVCIIVRLCLLDCVYFSYNLHCIVYSVYYGLCVSQVCVMGWKFFILYVYACTCIQYVRFET